jgi:hypothetical protein
MISNHKLLNGKTHDKVTFKKILYDLKKILWRSIQNVQVKK